MRPGKATGRLRARDNWCATAPPQVAGHVLAGGRIVLRSSACHTETSLSTPVDKRVDVRAESVSGAINGDDKGGAGASRGIVQREPGMEDG